MKIDIYPSAINGEKFLAVPAGTDFSYWKAPANFDSDLKKVRRLHSTHNLYPGQQGTAIDADDVINQITQNGWALITVRVTINVG